MKLTENFTLSEMVKSETALRNNLDNTPRRVVESTPGQTGKMDAHRSSTGHANHDSLD